MKIGVYWIWVLRHGRVIRKVGLGFVPHGTNRLDRVSAQIALNHNFWVLAHNRLIHEACAGGSPAVVAMSIDGEGRLSNEQ